MDVGKMDQTWVPSMPPLLSSDLDSIWTIKTLALCLDQKNFKNVGKNWLRKLKGENWGSGFTQTILKFTQMLQSP